MQEDKYESKLAQRFREAFRTETDPTSDVGNSCLEISNTNWRQRASSMMCNLKLPESKVKYCPGEKCKNFLPLHYFANNFNMHDTKDIYCIMCNQIKRQEKNERRIRIKKWSKGETCQIRDKFSDFVQKEKEKDKSKNDKYNHNWRDSSILKSISEKKLSRPKPL
jgi:hypothetical protein